MLLFCSLPGVASTFQILAKVICSGPFRSRRLPLHPSLGGSKDRISSIINLSSSSAKRQHHPPPSPKSNLIALPPLGCIQPERRIFCCFPPSRLGHVSYNNKNSPSHRASRSKIHTLLLFLIPLLSRDRSQSVPYKSCRLRPQSCLFFFFVSRFPITFGSGDESHIPGAKEGSASCNQ